MKQFNLVVVGGTFDHFHAGHKSLICKAFTVSNEVVIGLTSDIFIRRKSLSRQIQSYSLRKQALTFYIKKNFPRAKFKIIVLNDIYGPTLKNKNIQAIVVGPKTVAGAAQINKERIKNGLPKLIIIKAEYIKSNDGRYISSTRIRRGEINREGSIYARLLDNNLRISSQFRTYLKQIHGQILSLPNDVQRLISAKNAPLVAWVGDSVGRFFLENKIPFDIAVFDNRIRRQSDDYLKNILKGENIVYLFCKPGIVSKTFNKKMNILLKESTEKPIYIQVKGEDDLAAVSLVLSLSLGSLVFYGLFNVGIIMMEVTEQKKEEIKHFMLKSKKKVH